MVYLPLRAAFAAALALSPALTSAPLFAQESDGVTSEAAEQTPLEMRADQVVAIVNGELAPDDIFTDGFLRAVPPEQLAAISQQLTGQFGAAIAVESLAPPEGTRASLAIRMERAIAKGGIAIDPSDSDKISELLFQTFEPIDDSADKIEADLAALPGEVTWWFGPLDDLQPPIMARGAGDQMALGSTFKLYVLATLAREVAEGKRSWSDVVQMGEPRSFPSGQMQDWPADTSVTLETLATMMISISDNTATDALIRVLGRDTVYQTLVASGHSEPELNNPFMMTREMFLLKAGPASRLNTYQMVDAAGRTQILGTIEDTPLTLNEVGAAFSGGPIALDVEWFASAADLAALFAYMRETADPRAFEVMAVNPSMPSQVEAKWAYAGYKGGSEPGVLNLTWLLTDADGLDRALVLSWTNTEANLNEDALELIAQRILQLPQ